MPVNCLERNKGTGIQKNGYMGIFLHHLYPQDIKMMLADRLLNGPPQLFLIFIPGISDSQPGRKPLRQVYPLPS